MHAPYHIIWPDGKQDYKPQDGHVFDLNGEIWTWDDYMFAWVRGRGETYNGTPEKVELKSGCECGAHKTGSDKHSSWCPEYLWQDINFDNKE